MFSKIIGLITAVVLGMPIGGVYASADSPSKYLDRLTTVNTSMNRDSNDASPCVDDEPTVSHAVKTSPRGHPEQISSLHQFD